MSDICQKYDFSNIFIIFYYTVNLFLTQGETSYSSPCHVIIYNDLCNTFTITDNYNKIDFLTIVKINLDIKHNNTKLYLIEFISKSMSELIITFY